MKRNCPHCGLEQVVADEEIVAPWVFIRCHECERLSIVKKEGAPRAVVAPIAREAAKAPVARVERVEARVERIEARAEQTRARVPARIEPVRPEAVLGAFASAAGVATVAEDKEWQLPPYFSPFTAESEQVTLKSPPATPIFLKRKRAEKERDASLEALAKAIREKQPIQSSPVSSSVEADMAALEVELSSGSGSNSSSSEAGGEPSGDASSGSASDSSGRKQRLLGLGIVLIGMGFSLLVLKVSHKRHHVAPDPGELVPTPARVAAPVSPPISAPARAAAPAPAPQAQAQAQAQTRALAQDEPVAAPEAKRAPSGFWVVRVTGRRISLRAGPGTQFKAVGAVETGSRWKVRKWEGQWFQVEPEDLGPNTLGIGWIRNDFVKPEANGGSE